MSTTDEINEKIIANLREVYDPEISINVYDLGLIYKIDLSNFPDVEITHTLTSAFCPAADDIVDGIQYAAMSVEGIEGVKVITTFDPPFTVDMLSDEAKMTMGLL